MADDKKPRRYQMHAPTRSRALDKRREAERIAKEEAHKANWRKPSAEPRVVMMPGREAFEEEDCIVENPKAMLPDEKGESLLEPKLIRDKRNSRQCPVVVMFKYHVIFDRLKKAADEFRSTYEAAMVMGGVIDPAKIRVDASPTN